MRAGRYDAARSHLLRALEKLGEAGATAWQARCRLTVGALLDLQGRHVGAGAQAEQALSLYRDLGHRAGAAHALENLGWHLALLGAYLAAGACCRQPRLGRKWPAPVHAPRRVEHDMGRDRAGS